MDATDRVKRDRADVGNEPMVPGASKRQKLDHEGYGQQPECIRKPAPTSYSHDNYTVGWICALHIEMAAAEAMLDDVHDSLPKNLNDSNTYTLGRVGQHNVVIASLPAGGYGTNNAATVATNMERTFSSIQVRLMVGIGGGVPANADVRLGDVVVSTEIVQYDMGKTIKEGRFHRTSAPRRPPHAVMTAVSKLRAHHESNPSRVRSIVSEKFARNPLMHKYIRHSCLQDRLFASDYDHDESTNSCDRCDSSKLLTRPPRNDNNPKIHYGVVASGNQVMKHAKTRDQLAQELNILCFEMEAAGLMDGFPSLVVRGICDYSDSHKNKQWQEYAAATAAAYAKELLSVIHPTDTQKRSMTATNSTIGQEALRDQRKVLLDSLRFAHIDSRQTNIKPAYAKTCGWLLQHPDYVSWLDPARFSQHHGFLWIKGKPGAGKSTLMKFIYSRAKKAARKKVVASFFFNARGDELEKSTVGMYRSLLLQLLEKLPDLQTVLDTPDLIIRRQKPSFAWTTEILSSLLADAIEQLGQRSFTCYIDALDECDEEQVRAMIEDFENLGQRATAVNAAVYICFSSRHYPHIDIQNGQQLILEEQRGHGHDLEEYVRMKLKAGTEKFVEEVRSEVLQKAAGVFMWIVLVVDILNEEFRRGRQFAVKKRLAEIPTKLSELFKDILLRDNKNMDDLLFSIQWTLFPKRPLSPEEFYFAVVSALDPEQAIVEWDPDYTTTDTITRFVISSSKGLAEVTRSENQTVQFIHESVRDFLLKDNGLYDLWPGLADDFPSRCHDQLKHCCYNYLKMDISSYVTFDKELPKANSDEAKLLRQTISRKFPLLEYATSNTLHHANTAAPSVSQDDFVMAFNVRLWINLSNLFEKYQVRRYTSSASLLYILADTNQAQLIQSSIYFDPGAVNRRGERYDYPLLAALSNENRNATETFLQHGYNGFKGGTTIWVDYLEKFRPPSKFKKPLLFAIENGYRDPIRLLLELGADPNSQDRVGKTPLLLAIQKGHEDIMQLLLDKHADINTCLLLSAKEGSLDIVQLLLDKGADPNSRDTLGRTPLYWAIHRGHEDMAQLLLDKHADTNTCLLEFAKKGDLQKVQLLLHKGADPNSRDMAGSTPLYWAIHRGHEDMVQLLLDKHVDINTYLLEFAEKGDLQKVQLLLHKGADPNSRDTLGRTGLLIAVLEGHADIVQLLVDSHADVKTPQLKVAEEEFRSQVRISLRNDTNFNPEHIWRPTSREDQKNIVQQLLYGHSEINLAETSQIPLIFAIKKRRGDIVQMLLDGRAEPNFKYDLGKTPLSYARAKKCTEIVRVLLYSEGDVDLKEKDGWSPLSNAVWCGVDVELTRLFVDREADINSKDNEGWTALSRAAWFGNDTAVQLLLARGANANLKDNGGRTALFRAVQYGTDTTVQLLLAGGADVTLR